jgi:hypothetical protein
MSPLSHQESSRSISDLPNQRDDPPTGSDDPKRSQAPQVHPVTDNLDIIREGRLESGRDWTGVGWRAVDVSWEIRERGLSWMWSLVHATSGSLALPAGAAVRGDLAGHPGAKAARLERHVITLCICEIRDVV